MRLYVGCILLFALLSAAVAAPSHAQTNPSQAEETELPLEGVVTRAASSSDFDVNGVLVLCGSHTATGPAKDKTTFWHGCPHETPFLGEWISAYGWPNHKHHSFAADRLLIGLDMPQELTGRAIVEQVHRQGSDGTMLRADGYNILLSPGTKLHFKAPLRSASDLAPGLWISYKGKLRDDDVLVAGEATFTSSDIGEGEQNLIAKSDRISGSSAKHPPKFRPWQDAAMQARVDRIGNSLVPAFERPSPASDPIGTPIRFEVIDDQNCPGVTSLPNGVTLICAGTVQRMQNDSQLAALLAFSVASVIEHQDWRIARDIRNIDAVRSAEIIAAPLLLLPLDFAAAHQEKSFLLAFEAAQAARVSLWLLHDAGYDIHQAPVAWWLIASKKPEPLADIPFPLQSELLYMYLGLQWRKAPVAGQGLPPQK